VMALLRLCEAKLEESRSTLSEAEAMIKLSEKLADVTRQLMTREFQVKRQKRPNIEAKETEYRGIEGY
jgi:hypothetical protein